MRGTLALVGGLALLLLAGCDNSGPSKVDQLVSAAQVPSDDPIPTPPPAPTWDKMPDMLVDELGAYIGGRRASELDKTKGQQTLAEIVKALPIKGEQVSLRVIKKAKMKDVAEVVWALGKAGAPEVLIKTDARDDLPKELVVVPENQLDEVDPCSLAAMVTDKADTGVWGFSSQGGTRHRKGFAGPDLTNTEETMRKGLKRCESDTAFFSAAYNMPWEHAYSMGALFMKADDDKKIKRLVLCGDEPVAGRPIKLRDKK